jgi:hypothetical protein
MLATEMPYNHPSATGFIDQTDLTSQTETRPTPGSILLPHEGMVLEMQPNLLFTLNRIKKTNPQNGHSKHDQGSELEVNIGQLFFLLTKSIIAEHFPSC